MLVTLFARANDALAIAEDAVLRSESLASVWEAALARRARSPVGLPWQRSNIAEVAGLATPGALASEAVVVDILRDGDGWELSLMVPDARRGSLEEASWAEGLAPGTTSEEAFALAERMMRHAGWDIPSADGAGVEVAPLSPRAEHEPGRPSAWTGAWIARDANNRAAIFVTRGSGPVPERVAREAVRAADGTLRFEVPERLAMHVELAADADADPTVDAGAHLLPGIHPAARRALLHSRTAQQLLLATGDGRALPPTLFEAPDELLGVPAPNVQLRPDTAWFRRLDAAAARRAVEFPVETAVRAFHSVLTTQATWARAGYYIYEHICDGWASGPYGRTWVPAEPAELTAPEAPVVDTSFEEARWIDVAELTECRRILPGVGLK